MLKGRHFGPKVFMYRTTLDSLYSTLAWEGPWFRTTWKCVQGYQKPGKKGRSLVSEVGFAGQLQLSLKR